MAADPAPGAARIYEIEARVRFHVIAHSPHQALEALHELDDSTPLDLDASRWIDFIASCSVVEDTITDATDDYQQPEEVLQEHAASCEVCNGE